MGNLPEVRHGGASAPRINHGPPAASGDDAYEPDKETTGYLDCFLMASATCGNRGPEEGWW
jgi:hypothetical protein